MGTRGSEREEDVDGDEDEDEDEDEDDEDDLAASHKVGKKEMVKNGPRVNSGHHTLAW